MHRRVPIFTLIIIVILLTACQGNVPTSVLPTTTPAPDQPIPTITATVLPPPTVTAFPTATPSDSDQTPTGEETPGEGEAEESDVPTPGGEASPEAESAEPTATEAPLPTSTPVPTEAGDGPGGVTLGQSLFVADFIQGWPTVNESSAKVGIVSGEYVFEIGPFDGRFMTTAAVNASDMFTQIETRLEGGCPEKAGYGLYFHFTDLTDYYLISLLCDNTFSATARTDGALVDLGSGPLPDGIDATDAEKHTLGVVAVGSRYTLYFDEVEIGSFEDGGQESGDIAPYAFSQGENVLRVAFDNLEVWAVK